MNNTEKEEDLIIKKIKKMYENYGISTMDMLEDEFERLKWEYLAEGKNINKDLKESKKFKDQFKDSVI